MTDEVIDTPAVEPTPTATSEEQTVETPTPETEAVKEEPKPQAEESKTFSQAELDRIVQKEKAKAEARAERRALKVYAEKLEAMNKPQVQAQVEPAKRDGRPKIEDFTEMADYVDALTDWKLGEREANMRNQQAEKESQALSSKVENLFEAAEKEVGFDRGAFDELPISDAAAFAIMDSDVATKLMAHFVQNPKEAERINGLSPARQAAEIGKLEVKLSEAKQVKVSSAPAPIKPVGNRGGQTSKPVSEMSIEELREHEKKRGAKYY